MSAPTSFELTRDIIMAHCGTCPENPRNKTEGMADQDCSGCPVQTAVEALR